jgi:hypothetical protein
MRSLLPLLRPAAALRRLGARLALVALLAVALMPTFARLAEPAGLAGGVEICQSASAGASQDAAREHADACAFCTLAHTTPTLDGATPPAVAVLAYEPPAAPGDARVRAGVTQARAASARAPPSLA